MTDLDPAHMNRAIPLPSNPFSDQPRHHQAYQKCVDLESLALTNLALQKAYPPSLVAARLPRLSFGALREWSTRTRNRNHQRIR